MSNSSKVILRAKAVRKKDGKAPFCLRVIINRKIKLITLDQHLNPELWDEVKEKVKAGSGESEKLNLWIRKKEAQAAEIFYRFGMEDKPVTLNRFAEEWYKGEKTLCFFAFGEKVIRNKKLRPVTRNVYSTLLGKLKRHVPGLTLADIDYNWLVRWETYMRNELGNKQNTIMKNIKFIRVIFYEAIKQGFFVTNPFLQYTIKMEKTQRVFLTWPEVIKLQNLVVPARLAESYRAYMFACFTGLRWQDVERLQWQDLVSIPNLQNGAITHTKVLQIYTHKTDQPVIIPIQEHAQKILDNCRKDRKMVFNLGHNQTVNDQLKEIAALANIPKKIKFHSGRHTFATISLNIGIPLESVQELLGHETIKTTQIYAKISNTTQIMNMQKWDLLAK